MVTRRAVQCFARNAFLEFEIRNASAALFAMHIARMITVFALQSGTDRASLK